MSQELRSHYERFETEYLLELAQTDLTDDARATLNSVLRGRNVSEEVLKNARSKGETEERVALEKEDRLAPRLGRLVAFAIDFWGCLLIAYLVTFPLLRPISESAHENVAVLIWGAYFLSKDWLPGGSLGKRLLKYKVVEADTPHSISWWKSFVRNIANFLQILDWLPALGKRRMRFGDMVAGTEVVRRNSLQGGAQ